MEFDKETNTFRFTPDETMIVGADKCPVSVSGAVLGLLVGLRTAASDADVTQFPTPQARRTFIDQQAGRIARINDMIDFITPFANEQIHQEAAQFLAEQ